jgi:hypothetical protein
MKKHLYLFTILLIPIAAFAQPTISDMDNFSNGEIYKRGSCSSTNVSPGASGASQTWNFTGLAFIDTEIVEITAPSATPYGSQFPTANFSLYSDHTQQYVYITKGSVYNTMIGLVDPTANVTVKYNPNPATASKHPISYNDHILDTFANTLTQGLATLNGGGTVEITADGWGTLQLPDSSFSNVLRVKTVVIQRDSAAFPPTYIDAIRTTYAWYADGRKAPLLSWDSLDVSGAITANDITVSYLITSNLSAKNIVKNAQAFTGSLYNNSLLLNGKFESGMPYKAELINIDGRKLFSTVFTTNKESMSLDLQQEIPSGIYLVSVMKTNDINSQQVLKLVKE